MKYKYTYVVEGSGHFPSDMLRYDVCEPYKAEDRQWIAGTNSRSAMMVSKYKPTVGRWESFGWSVDMIQRIKE